ncbi:aldo/keto reductase [Luedemannella flava]
MFEAVAKAHGVSPQRVCLAWMLAKAPVVIPIPGASRPESIVDSIAATDLVLTDDEYAALDAANVRP